MSNYQATHATVEDLGGIVTEANLLQFLKSNLNSRGSQFFVKGQSLMVGNLTHVWNNLLTAQFDDKTVLFEGPSNTPCSVFSARLTLEWLTDEENLISEFNDRFKIGLISSFQDAIMQILIEDPDVERYLRCCLVNYDANMISRVDVGRVSTVIRISFPNLVINSKLQGIIFQEAVSNCRRRNIMSLLSYVPVSTDIFNNLILLYNQHPQVMLHNCRPTYEFYRQVNPDAINLSNYKCAIEDVFRLSALRAIDVSELELNLGTDLEHYMPLLLSRCYGVETKVSYKQTVRSMNLDDVGGGFDYSKELDDIELSELFLSMISPDRYYVPHYFRDIGRALHGVYDQSDEGLWVWVREARKVVSSVEDQHQLPDHLQRLERCTEEYNNFSIQIMGTDVRTLAWYAKKDSPDEYADWHDTWALNAIETAAYYKNHESVAEVFYRLNWLTILTCPIPGDKSVHWYTYSKNIWNESANRSSIIQQFTEDVSLRFKSISHTLASRVGLSQQSNRKDRFADEDDDPNSDSEDNQEERDDALKKYVKNIDRLIYLCGCSGFMSGVFTFAAAKLQVEGFFKYKNMNLNLTAMTNGVVESSYRDKTIIFREGKPQDYLTITTGKRLPINYTWHSPEVKRYTKWIKQVYHTQGLIRHIHKLFASGYIGGNLDKIIVFMLGAGNNAKSTIIKCISNAWGDYMTMIPFTVLTSHPPGPEKPNPLAFMMSGPRWAIACEPSDEDQAILAGSVKNETGNDDRISRLCHGNYMHKIVPTAVLIASLNKMMRMLGFGAAIRNRVKVITHNTTYEHHAPADKATQKQTRTYPIDVTFIDHVKSLGEAMLWVAYQYFTAYVTEKLEDPPEITEATQAYWEETDYYLMYVSDRLDRATKMVDGEEVPDENVKISVDRVYKDFQLWFAMHYPNQYPPNQTNFAHYMIEHIGRAFDRHWIGISLMDDDGDYDFEED